MNLLVLIVMISFVSVGSSTATTHRRPNGSKNVTRCNKCGNGIIDKGEECDNGVQGNDNLRGNCTTECRKPRCGDGLLHLCVDQCLADDCSDCVASKERCDDGNTYDGDGCSSQCLYEGFAMSSHDEHGGDDDDDDINKRIDVFFRELSQFIEAYEQRHMKLVIKYVPGLPTLYNMVSLHVLPHRLSSYYALRELDDKSTAILKNWIDSGTMMMMMKGSESGTNII
jgi:cysteine-rich repeat protein